MKRSTIVGLLAFTLIMIESLFVDAQYNINNSNNFTLFELFTSEGCSSCPAADKTLADIQQQYKNKNVLILAYHVDYWNSLGWKDAFSTESNTQRQEYYSQIFNLNSNYTPQVVVNGRKQFIGSDRPKILNAISEQNTDITQCRLEVNAVIKRNNVSVTTKTANLPAGSIVIVCLVQKQATTKVKAGENADRMLQHMNVVRDFVSVNAGNNIQTTDLVLSNGLSGHEMFIAAFIQNKRTGVITALNTKEIN